MMVTILKELKRLNIKMNNAIPRVHCKVFEDNSGALEMAKIHKYRPRTKHLNVKYHHFREHVAKKLVSVCHIATDKQQADIFTKSLDEKKFCLLRSEIMGW